MRCVVLALIILSGCTTFGFNKSWGGAPSYTTRHGMKVYLRGEVMPRKESIELLAEYTANVMDGDISKLDGYRVLFINRWIKVGTGKEFSLADGYTNSVGKIMIISVFQDCFADSSYIHELAHALFSLQGHSKLFMDHVKKIEQGAIKEFCSKDYKPRNIPPDINYVAK